jgi:hypothetical protein
MKTHYTTPCFPAWRSRLAARGHRILSARTRSAQEVESEFGQYLPKELFKPPATGAGSRKRLFPWDRTFWCFLWQALQPQTSCRAVVRKVQAQSEPQRLRVDENTSAYCQARKRLPIQRLTEILRRSAESADRIAGHRVPGWDRPIKLLDATSFRMPDTPANRKAFTYPAGQKKGCGFPVAKALALLSLASGALLQVVTGKWSASELGLLQSLWALIDKGDLVLGDRAFGVYVVIANLFCLRADGLFRLHQGRQLDKRRATRIGQNDWQVTWHKPPYQKAPYLSARQWAALPESVAVRILYAKLPVKGFRTRDLWLVTTLLDPLLYPAERLVELYFRRWGIELCFRDIKTTMGMEDLRCLSPAMIHREILVFLIAHNCIRALMAEAARSHQVPTGRLSFKGTVDTVRGFHSELAHASSPRRLARLRHRLTEIIAVDQVPLRPHRSEPRAVKRRPKKFHLLNKPRHLMGNLPHLNYPSKRAHHRA